MRWTSRGRSADLEDRRDEGGGGSRLPGGRLGIGGFLILLVLSLIFKKNLFTLLGTETASVDSPAASGSAPQAARSPEDEKMVDLVSFVLDESQDFWTEELRKRGVDYPRAKLALFTDTTETGCGGASSATGPFYCPADQHVFIDLGFYRELDRRFGAPGDFAQAYVVAHEIGHHVQTVLGIEERVRKAQRADPRSANELSIAMELQADCFAGLWGRSIRDKGILEPGDAEEGIAASAAVGDDRLQKMATGTVQPEKWTHGSSRQRVEWFRRGFTSGRFDECDPFAH